jgi:hypothetical protein
MQTFQIAPAEFRAMWLIVVVVLLAMMLAGVVLAMAIRGSRSSTFEVSSEGLRLRGDLYGRLIPASHVRGSEARRVDFAVSPELQPRRRTMGTGMPGYQAGWFRLQNGDKALVYMTDRGRAVHVPTTEGYAVLVSPIDPDGFVSALSSLR